MTDLAELFARDPEHLTHTDLQTLVERYREARRQFNLGAQQAGATKRLKATKLTTLDDLDI